MSKRITKLLLALVACGALAAGGSVFAQAQSQSQPAPKASATPAAADTDHVQSGDQTTPDKADKADPADKAEQPGTESETAPGSDGPGGHADEPGNAGADHQVQGAE